MSGVNLFSLVHLSLALEIAKFRDCVNWSVP